MGDVVKLITGHNVAIFSAGVKRLRVNRLNVSVSSRELFMLLPPD
jgi:hypothetical protein